MTLTPSNVEAAAVGALTAATGSPFSTRVPNPRPSTPFGRVQRTGGAAQNLVQERPVILVECWAASGKDAWSLAVKAWGAMQGREPLVHNGIELSPSTDTAVSSPVNYPDPSTSSARYQFTAELIVNLAKGSTP